jgi:hypothetical protein
MTSTKNRGPIARFEGELCKRYSVSLPPSQWHWLEAESVTDANANGSSSALLQSIIMREQQRRYKGKPMQKRRKKKKKATG